jgi:hypothetical protein
MKTTCIMTDERHLVWIAIAARARSTRFEPKAEEMMSRGRIVRSVSLSGQFGFWGRDTWRSEWTSGSGPASSNAMPPLRSTVVNYRLRKERATVLLPRRLVMPLPLPWSLCADGAWRRRNGLWRKD